MVCEQLGRLGSEAPPDAIVQLILAAEEDDNLRPAVADSLIKISTEQVATELFKRTEWMKDKKGNRVGKNNYPIAYQRWAIETIGGLNVKNMSKDVQTKLVSKLKDEARFDPDADCRKLANNALSKLELQINSAPMKQ
jgi:hypothetical protein